MKLLNIILVIIFININRLSFSKSFQENDYVSEDYSINEFDNETESLCKLENNLFVYTPLLYPEDYNEDEILKVEKHTNSMNETMEKLNRIYIYNQNVSTKLGPITKRFAHKMSELAYNSPQISPECMSSLVEIGKAIHNGESWARKFIDSQPTISLGKIDGTMSGSYADYDLCLSIKSPQQLDKPIIKGKYCSLGIKDDYFLSLFPLKKSDLDYLLSMNQGNDSNLPNITFDGVNLAERAKALKAEMKIPDMQSIHDLNRMIGLLEGFGYKSNDFIATLCLPTTCETKDIEKFIHEMIYPLIPIKLSINPDCEYEGKKVEITRVQMSIIATFAILTILVLLSTLIDYLLKIFKSQITLPKFFESFLIGPNVKEIFDLEAVNKRFDGLDGIKALLTITVFLIHEYTQGGAVMAFKNMLRSSSYKLVTDNRYVWFRNINLLDGYLLIGGFLVCYVMLSKLEKWNGKFDYSKYLIYRNRIVWKLFWKMLKSKRIPYIHMLFDKKSFRSMLYRCKLHVNYLSIVVFPIYPFQTRYLRGQPLVFLAIAIYLLLPLLGSGPFYKIVTGVFVKSCEKTWWRNVLLINNIMSVESGSACVPHAWFWALDFQLFAIAPLVVIPLYRYPKWGAPWALLFILLSILLGALPRLFGVLYPFEYTRMQTIKESQLGSNFNYAGVPHSLRIYAIGLFLGYLIRKHDNVYLGGRIGEGFIWVISFTMTGSALYWQKDFINPLKPVMSETEAKYWLAFGKLLYAPATFWLFHMIVIYYRLAKARDPVTLDEYMNYTYFVFDFIYCYIVSLFVAIILTKPFGKIVDYFMPRPKIEILKKELTK